MRILVTGADGFAGAHIVDYLLEQGHEVVCLLRKDGQHRLPTVLSKHRERRVSIVRHDLTKPIPALVDELIGDVDVVISAASSTDIAGSIRNPLDVFMPNVQIIANLAEWARHRDLAAFVQVSSEEVYGPAPHDPHREWEPIRPSTHYSASKAAQEAYLIASWRSHGLPLILLNAMNLIGPMQEPTKLVPTIIRKVVAGEQVPLLVAWDEPQSGMWGESLRQYMHPRSIASAALHVLNDPAKNWTPNIEFPPRYNVAGEQVGNVALAQQIAAVLNEPLKWSPLASESSRPGHERVFALDDTKLHATGWVPPSTLAETIEETIAWYREHE